jgi:hypothetical protein
MKRNQRRQRRAAASQGRQPARQAPAAQPPAGDAPAAAGRAKRFFVPFLSVAVALGVAGAVAARHLRPADAAPPPAAQAAAPAADPAGASLAWQIRADAWFIANAVSVRADAPLSTDEEAVGRLRDEVMKVSAASGRFADEAGRYAASGGASGVQAKASDMDRQVRLFYALEATSLKAALTAQGGADQGRRDKMIRQTYGRIADLSREIEGLAANAAVAAR